MNVLLNPSRVADTREHDAQPQKHNIAAMLVSDETFTKNVKA